MGSITIVSCGATSFTFPHILDFNAEASRPIPRKNVLGKCTPTPEATSFSTNPRVIDIVSRVSSAEKTILENIKKECCWHTLYVDGAHYARIWIVGLGFRWDSNLGCGGRQWIARIKLSCRYR